MGNDSLDSQFYDNWIKNPWTKILFNIIEQQNQMKWQGLTKKDVDHIVNLHTSDDAGYDIWCNGTGVARAVEALLESRNQIRKNTVSVTDIISQKGNT